MNRQRLGQYFLKDSAALKKIAASLRSKPEETIVEIGAGRGELTEFLRKENPDSKIIAIEKDGELAEFLLKKFEGDANIKIVEGDALKILPQLIASRESENSSQVRARDWKLTGNIPYYITGHLLRLLGENVTPCPDKHGVLTSELHPAGAMLRHSTIHFPFSNSNRRKTLAGRKTSVGLENKPVLSIFTLQKEVAERIAAEPPKMNRLAASVQFWAEPKILGHIPKTKFDPPPEVDSAIIMLSAKKYAGARGKSAKKYYSAVRALFAQPRKTILNNIQSAIVKINPEKKEKILQKLETAGIKPQDRPQNVNVENIIAISNIFDEF